MKSKFFLFLLSCTFATLNGQELKRSYYNGIGLQPINDSIAKKYNYTPSNGLLVIKVVSNGSAANVGVKENDIVFSVNASIISQTADLKSGKLGQIGFGQKIIRSGLV